MTAALKVNVGSCIPILGDGGGVLKTGTRKAERSVTLTIALCNRILGGYAPLDKSAVLYEISNLDAQNRQPCMYLPVNGIGYLLSIS